MKIALLNTLYYPYELGGAERSVRLLAEGLVAFGHEVTVLCIAPKASVQVINDVKVHFIKLRNIYLPYQRDRHWAFKGIWHAIDVFNPMMGKSIGSILDNEKPDVVHTNSLAGFSVIAWRETKKRELRLVHTIREYYLLCPQSTMFWNGHNCRQPCMKCKLFTIPKAPFFNLVDHVVGISQYVLDRHLQQGYFTKAGKSIIRNIHSLNASPRPKTSSKGIRFGYIGRIDPKKGIKCMLEAFINSKGYKVSTLIIAGTGFPDDLLKLKHYSENSNIAHLGTVEPGHFYNRVDVVIVPSIWHEPLGRTILEAYAYGLPVIAANRGGIPEIVKEGKTGFLFDPDDKCDLVRCLEKFTSDVTLTTRMSSACFEEAKKFCSGEIVKEYLSIYKV